MCFTCISCALYCGNDGSAVGVDRVCFFLFSLLLKWASFNEWLALLNVCICIFFVCFKVTKKEPKSKKRMRKESMVGRIVVRENISFRCAGISRPPLSQTVFFESFDPKKVSCVCHLWFCGWADSILQHQLTKYHDTISSSPGSDTQLNDRGKCPAHSLSLRNKALSANASFRRNARFL